MTYDVRNLTPDGKRIVKSQQSARRRREVTEERKTTWVIGRDRGAVVGVAVTRSSGTSDDEVTTGEAPRLPSS